MIHMLLCPHNRPLTQGGEEQQTPPFCQDCHVGCLFAAECFPASFQDAVSAATDEERLVKIHDVIQQLPPPHYR